MGKLRGISLYAIDETSEPMTLCAAAGKKIVIFHLEGGRFVEKKELSIGEPARYPLLFFPIFFNSQN